MRKNKIGVNEAKAIIRYYQNHNPEDECWVSGFDITGFPVLKVMVDTKPVMYKNIRSKERPISGSCYTKTFYTVTDENGNDIEFPRPLDTERKYGIYGWQSKELAIEGYNLCVRDCAFYVADCRENFRKDANSFISNIEKRSISE